MAKTKNQFNRLEILHNLLVKNKPVSWTEIQNCYRNNGIIVTKKTVFNDLYNLKDNYDAPLRNEKGKYSYEKSFSFLDRLSVVDSLLATEVQTLLYQFAEFPAFGGLEDIWVRLQERIPNTQKKNIVQFELNNDYIGLKRINQLYEAIKNKNCLRIIYKDFDKSPQTYTLNPYLLKEYNNRWHVYGYESTKGKLLNLALDRIENIEISLFTYREQKSNEISFLEEIIGFTYTYNTLTETYTELESIKISFEKKRAYYVRTKPLHSSQRELYEENTHNSCVFEYHLRQNKELISKILEFGQDATVLSPPSLRAAIKEHILGMLKAYE